MKLFSLGLPTLLIAVALAVFGLSQPAQPVATPTLSGLSAVDHIQMYGGCAPSYNLSGATATSWSITGTAYIVSSSSTQAIVATTRHGRFTITAHTSQGNVSKTVDVVYGAPCP